MPATAMRNEFSVYQWFVDGSYEEVLRFIPGEEAVRVAVNLAMSVGARMGTTIRVIITDGGDLIAWEWKFNEGIVFPPAATKPPLTMEWE